MAHVYNSQLDAFSQYHKIHEPSSSIGPALPALGHALAGSTGTAISNLCIYPLDLVITRLQVQRTLRKSSSTPHEGEYTGVLDAFDKIYNNEGGIAAFYAGIVQDTGKSIADSFLFFLFYNYLRSNRLKKHGTNSTTLPALDELFVGSLAGACSKFFTTPISNIVTRKQTASLISSRSSTPHTEPSVHDIANKIRQEKGLQGFWSGYSASLVLTLNPSLTFFLYELFKRSFLPRSQRDNPGARVTFLMAAVSKAIASTITYPFSLAKARAQADAAPPVDTSSASEIKNEAKNVTNEKEAKAVGRDAKSFAKRNTVFTTILDIYRNEGPAALYEGVWGEILKGFFSHGITMLVKETIHKLIIQAYYIILKAQNKFPSPTEMANQASQAVSDGAERASGAVKEGYETVVEGGKDLAGRAGVIGSNATEVAKNAVQGSGNITSNAASTAKNAVENVAERAGVAGSNTTETTKNAVGQTAKVVGEKGGNVSEGLKQGGEELKSKDAGHLLGNAQNMLGDKIVQVGEGVKGAKGPREE